MTREDYERYVKSFNARDYAALETFFTDDFVLETGGFTVVGKPAFRAFYAFLHAHFRETVTLRRFFPGADAVAAEVSIRFDGIKDLSADALAKAGYPAMTPVPAGGSAVVEFIIVYELDAAGLIHHIKGAVFVPAAG